MATMSSGYSNAGYSRDRSSSSSGEDEAVKLKDTTKNRDYYYVPKDEELLGWDRFKQNEFEYLSASEKQTNLILKGAVFLKIVTSIVVFIVVLTAGVVSKGALFYIVAQVGPNRNETFCPQLIGLTPKENGTLYEASYDDSTALSWIWSLLIVFCVPQGLIFLRSLKTMMMMRLGRPAWHQFLTVFCLETAHVTGLALLFLGVFPGMDSIKAVMTMNCLALFPALLKFFNPNEIPFPGPQAASAAWVKPTAIALNVVAVVFQLTGFVIFPVMQSDSSYPFDNSWALPVGLFLASLGWWESYVTSNAKFVVSKYLFELKNHMIMKQSRYFIYAFISVWKGLWFFFMFMAFTVGFDRVTDIDTLFSTIGESFDRSIYNVTLFPADGGNPLKLIITNDSWINNMASDVVVIQVICAWACFMFAKFAAKTRIQPFAFALPLTLVVPVTLAGLTGMCHERNDDPCVYKNLPPFTFFNCPVIGSGNILADDLGLFWFFWLLSHIWITLHIWFPKSQKLAGNEQMFGTPYYDGLSVDQSVVFNRRADSGKVRLNKVLAEKNDAQNEFATISDDDFAKVPKKNKKRYEAYSDNDEEDDEDEVTRVYGCATMWHESPEEITEMLKSIFRIDEDCSARRIARDQLAVKDPDYYEWETHIFFDDCMEPDETGKDFVVNDFVKLLVSQIEEQGKRWYGVRKMKVPPPARFATPYGGRLIWTLPGKTQISCHLKDKNKIRHKKRWSQIMYMYYFLGYFLADRSDLTERQKEIRSQNTFLLALDGDVDFQPDAIIKLVDLMKRNPNIGASCGRIHPIGSGYMQWYQKFEYAIGHWLQKSTEHVMGCVLCSPGCFSLFRGKAVMDDNVMRTYTTVATEPKHYIQYDQGEDRWLCTLLLQQGWRVEYSAASDSFTACPEGFREFYNQRRRWMPSTLANVANLLSDYKRVVKNNDDISIFYIAYQTFMMVGTVLGPGSIFLMLVGAFGIAFGIDIWVSFAINLVPLTIYVIACFTTKPDTQIMIAQVLSILYALVMMAVMVGMILMIQEDGWLAPTTLSIMFISFVFVLAACLHPQEFWCLPMGIIYFITIPSMYLLLVLYSVFNMNVVSWGTREVAVKLTADEQAAKDKAAEDEAKKPPKKKGGIMGWCQSNRFMEFNMSNMMKDKDGLKLRMDLMLQKMEKMEKAMKKEGYNLKAGAGTSSSSSDDDHIKRPGIPTIVEPPMLSKPTSGVKRSPTIRFTEPPRNDMINPKWIEQEYLGDGPRKHLRKKEITFWNSMIEKYLKPLEKDAEKEKAISAGLVELKNQMSFSFLMINCIWVVTIFLLQANKDMIFVEWPWGMKGPNMTYVEATYTIHLEYEPLELEPIGLMFMVMFAGILLIQLIGMLLHRSMTLSHVVATTNLRMSTKKICCGKTDKFDPEKLLKKDAVELIKQWQTGYNPDITEGGGNAMTLEDAVTATLDVYAGGDPAAMRRMSEGSAIMMKNPNLMRAETISALKRRRTQARRNTTMRRARQPNPIPEGPESPAVMVGEHAMPLMVEKPNYSENNRSRSSSESSGDDMPDGGRSTGAVRRRPTPSEGQSHVPVERTMTYTDPDGVEDREV